MPITLLASTILNDATTYDARVPWTQKNQPIVQEFFENAIIGKIIVMGTPCGLLGIRDGIPTPSLGGLSEILEVSRNKEVCVIGGPSAYTLFLPHAQELLFARVMIRLWNGSNNSEHFAYFPKFSHERWGIDHSYTRFVEGANNAWQTAFFRYVRKTPA